MNKAGALEHLAAANSAAVEAENAAALAQDRKRSAVRQAFEAGCTAPEVAGVLGSSPQWAYQLRDKPPLKVT